MTLEIVLATSNPGKLIEMQAVLSERYPADALRLILPASLGLALEVDENGSTYAENASLKARAYSDASGLPAMADDSGLEVAVLEGAPGLHSARYDAELNGGNSTDASRRAYLLRNLAGMPKPWYARFVCTIAIALPDGSLQLAEGACPGEISPVERGSNGFGYDPVFYLPQYGRTMAELNPKLKNLISHRAQALRNAFPIIDSLLDANSRKIIKTPEE